MSEQNPKKIRSPGEIIIESIVISSYNGFEMDVRNHMFELVLQESIDLKCVCGNLVLYDNINLIRHFPLIGNEHITITFFTPSRSRIVKRFFCYKTDPRFESESNRNSALFSINFVSYEFITSLKKKFSQSFRNTKYSDIVKTIYDKYIQSSKKITIQPTLDKKNYVFPYMSPFEAIDTLCLLSISENNEDKSYTFYEDLDGFYFTCLNYFAKSSSDIVSYTWFKPNVGVTTEATALGNLEKDFYRIESYKQISSNNTINNIENGLFSSFMLLHDTTYKTLTSSKFSYNNDFKLLNTLNSSGTLPTTNDEFSKFNYAHYRMYPRQSYNFNNVFQSDDFHKTILRRNAHLAQMENLRLSILVPGDSQRRVGECVNVNIPSIDPGDKNKDGDFDIYLSGKYLVTQITHIIGKSKYQMRLELERDSIPIAYPTTKTVDKK